MQTLGVWLLTLVAATWRIRVVGTIPHTPVIIAFWHGDMLPVWWLCRRLHPMALISQSKDGEHLNAILTRWGYTVVRGSSSQGGRDALNHITEAARSSIVMITPDGPRGPRRVAKPGAVVAAQRSGTPVLPLRIHTEHGKVFERSWDRFTVPLPFSRVTISVGKTLMVAHDASREETSAMIDTLTEELNAWPV